MERNKNTLLVNLYAGPGAGKSTGAAYIFAKLKMTLNMFLNMRRTVSGKTTSSH